MPLTQEDSMTSQDSTATIMDDSRSEILYFAFGSNLSTDQMLQRCPSSTPIGIGHLQGWSWIINSRGYANIVQTTETGGDGSTPPPARSADGGVYGLLYLLPPDDESALDKHEGVPWAYGKSHVAVTWERDERGAEMDVPQTVTALVYVDTQRTEGSVTKKEYVGRMNRGIDEAVVSWGMDEDYADAMRKWLVR